MSKYNSKLPIVLFISAFMVPFVPQSESAAAPEESIEASEDESLEASEDESIEVSEDVSLEAFEDEVVAAFDDVSAESDELLTDEDSEERKQGIGVVLTARPKSLRVCNSTTVPAWTAVMVRAGNQWITKGWTTVPSGGCKRLINKYRGRGKMYVYAEQANEMPFPSGSRPTRVGCVKKIADFTYTSNHLCDIGTGGTDKLVNFVVRPTTAGLWTWTL